MTGSSARQAVVNLVLRALFAACAADFGAQHADLLREFASSCHEAGCLTADCSAVHVECNATRHHLHVLLAQACGRAVVTGFGARVARFNAGLIHRMLHERSFQPGAKRAPTWGTADAWRSPDAAGPAMTQLPGDFSSSMSISLLCAAQRRPQCCSCPGLFPTRALPTCDYGDGAGLLNTRALICAHWASLVEASAAIERAACISSEP